MGYSCFYPRSIYVKESIDVYDGTKTHFVNVPCGKCENCIKRRRAEWCFRMEEELKVSKCAWFVTLTYKKVKYDKWGNMILVRKDLTNFFKRLRIQSERTKEASWENVFNNLDYKKDKIKYYACGEYGELGERPHYHAIIFNASRKQIIEAWKDGDGVSIGIVHIKTAVPESISYVTKYIDKWRNKKQDWKKPKEFSVMSKGIGKVFVDKVKNFYKSNLDINYCVNSRGIKIPMPRYYRLLMFDELEIFSQRGIIHNRILEITNEGIEKHGAKEFYKREEARKRYIQKNWNKGSRKRDFSG